MLVQLFCCLERRRFYGRGGGGLSSHIEELLTALLGGSLFVDESLMKERCVSHGKDDILWRHKKRAEKPKETTSTVHCREEEGIGNSIKPSCPERKPASW